MASRGSLKCKELERDRQGRVSREAGSRIELDCLPFRLDVLEQGTVPEAGEDHRKGGPKGGLGTRVVEPGVKT